MIDKASDFSSNSNSISTADLDGTAATPVGPRPPAADSSPVSPLYPPEGPAPEGTNPAAAQEMAHEAALKGENAPGVEAEHVVWEARYSMKNFVGRLTLWSLATLAWLGFAVSAWSRGTWQGPNSTVLGGLGIALGIAWLWLAFRIFKARRSHFYQLTTRRLFITTGLLRRRRDQMELIAIKDVFERQTLLQRWLSVGTVVVVSPKAELPTFYLTGVNDPKRVMDLVWHYARAEREGKTVQVENL